MRCTPSAGPRKEARAASSARSSGSNKKGSDKHFPVEPFATEALGLEGVGDLLIEVRVVRLHQDHRAQDGTKHITLLSSPVCGEGGTGGESGDGFSLVPGRGFWKMRAESLADTRPLGVAEHVDKIQVGRHQRLNLAVGHHAWAGWCQ